MLAVAEPKMMGPAPRSGLLAASESAAGPTEPDQISTGPHSALRDLPNSGIKWVFITQPCHSLFFNFYLPESELGSFWLPTLSSCTHRQTLKFPAKMIFI